MIKRAHTEVRPYRLIVPVVLHFRLLVLAWQAAEPSRGEAGGDCQTYALVFLLINPPQLPLTKGEKRTSHVYFLLLVGGGQEGIVSRMGLFGTDFTDYNG